MKNFIKSILLFILLVLISSCESDQSGQQNSIQPNNSGILVSITEELQPNNYIAITNFSNGKITDVQYNDGSYDSYGYENDLIKTITKYDIDDVLEVTIAYEYDNLGRMTLMTFDSTEAYSGGSQYTTSEFLYNTDDIITIYKSYDNSDALISEYQYKYTLSNDLIVKFNPISQFNSLFTTVEYGNENPISLTSMLSDGIIEFTELNYSNNLAADAYSINKYLFGNEWKNNGVLSQTPESLSVESLRGFSNNYLVGYTSNLPNNGVSISNDVTYQFDSENRLQKQTRTKVVNPNNQTFVDTYTYQYE
jgi:hypothetical protein